MADRPKFGKRALIVAVLCAVVGGIWFGRCTRNVPAEASSGGAGSATASAWAPAASASAPAAVADSADPAKLEPQHFDITENPKIKAGVSLRDLDKDIFAKLNDVEHLKREQMNDVFPDKPYLVRFIGSVETKSIGFVFIDLERNGKVDEKWEIRGNEVRRTVPKDPHGADNEVRYSLSQGKWQVR